jgi:hypothetical protein
VGRDDTALVLNDDMTAVKGLRDRTEMTTGSAETFNFAECHGLNE